MSNYAFYECGNLANVTIPRSVESIGTEAFNYPGRLTVYGIVGTCAET